MHRREKDAVQLRGPHDRFFYMRILAKQREEFMMDSTTEPTFECSRYSRENLLETQHKKKYINFVRKR